MRDHWEFFLAALAETDQPRAVFAALETITKESVGTILFTAMTHDADAMRSLRVYSGNEAAYPLGGWKPLRCPSRPLASAWRRCHGSLP